MGANASTQKQTLITTIQNESKASCKTQQDANQQINGLTISLIDSNCKDIEVLNRAKLSSQCDLGAMSRALAEASMELTAQQTTSLLPGINVNTSEQDRQTHIKNKLEAECGQTQLVKQKIEDAVITLQGSSCDNLKVMNDLDATSQCVLKLAFDAVDKQAAAGSTAQKTGSLIPDIGVKLGVGLGLGLVGIVVVVVIIIMVVRSRKKKGEEGQGEEGPPGGEQGLYEEGAYAGEGQQGGRRRRRRGGLLGGIGGWGSITHKDINWGNVPITVLGIMMLVWYAKMTEPKK